MKSVSSETERAVVLAQYPIDKLRAEKLDQIANLAAQLCQTPFGAVSIVYEDQQTFVGRFGLDSLHTPRSQSFCAHAMAGRGLMLVSNTLDDPRFSENPLVLGAPFIRFYAGQPLVSAEGVPLGAICVFDSKPRDGLTTEQANGLDAFAGIAMALLESWRTEERNRKKSSALGVVVAELEQRFGVLADTLPQMVWMTETDGGSIYFNKVWCAFTGQPAESSFGYNWLGFVHPEDAPNAAKAWDDAVAGQLTYKARYRLRRHDGSYHWVIARGLPLRGRAGAIVRWVGTCTDINDEMEAADALEVLSHELNHRIKNTFAVISGLVGLSARDKPEAQVFAKDLSERIVVLSRAHGFALSRSHRNEGKAGMTLHSLIRQVLAPYLEEGESHITISGDDLSLSERCTTPLALTMHELATNAVKYGAIATPGGRLAVTTEAGSMITINWRESGVGPLQTPERTGFGSRLLQMSIERQLAGRLESGWGEDGLTVTMMLPRSNLET